MVGWVGVCGGWWWGCLGGGNIELTCSVIIMLM